MRNLIICIILVLGTNFAQSQFFAQKLPQIQVKGAQDAFVVINTGDTIRGRLSQVSYQDSLISRVNFRVDGEKMVFPIENIKLLALVPYEIAGFEEAALMPRLRSIKNKEFIEALPEGDYVYYERIQIPNTGRRVEYRMAQLMNAGFDSKVKVYAHPEGRVEGYTKVWGVATDGMQDDVYYVKVGEDRPFEFRSFQYRRKSLERIYSFCPELRDQKLKWKNFAEHVFTHFQKCL